MRIALAQIETAVGDVAGNARAIRAGIERARGAGARLVAFPELALVGYPPLDLLLEPGFVAENRRRLECEIVFAPASEQVVHRVAGTVLGVLISEDLGDDA